jgi:peptidoglycan/LPS O-acetylase OafA/YrhL
MDKLQSGELQRFDSLDGLRGFAVILVILFHFARLSFISFSFEIGWIGVQLFFVLSGFLITRILLKNPKNSITLFLKQFYFRRILRIFPLYFFYLLLITVIFVITHEPDDFLIDLPYLATFTYNFSILLPEWKLSRMHVHLWSLSVEEQFYLIWPLLIYFLSEKSVRKIILLIIFISPLLRILIEINISSTNDDLKGNIIYWLTISHFDAFALGGAINFLNGSLLRISKFYWLVITLTAVIIAGALNIMSLSHLNKFDYSSLGYPIHGIQNGQYIWSYTLLNLFFASLVWYLISSRKTLLDFKPLRTLGKISYGMYVYHFLLIIIFDKVLINPIYNDFITFLIYFSACILVSYSSYFFMEKRFLLLKAN